MHYLCTPCSAAYEPGCFNLIRNLVCVVSGKLHGSDVSAVTHGESADVDITVHCTKTSWIFITHRVFECRVCVWYVFTGASCSLYLLFPVAQPVSWLRCSWWHLLLFAVEYRRNSMVLVALFTRYFLRRTWRLKPQPQLPYKIPPTNSALFQLNWWLEDLEISSARLQSILKMLFPGDPVPPTILLLHFDLFRYIAIFWSCALLCEYICNIYLWVARLQGRIARISSSEGLKSSLGTRGRRLIEWEWRVLPPTPAN